HNERDTLSLHDALPISARMRCRLHPSHAPSPCDGRSLVPELPLSTASQPHERRTTSSVGNTSGGGTLPRAKRWICATARRASGSDRKSTRLYSSHVKNS